MTAEQALEKAREVLAEFDTYDTCSRQGLPTEQQEHIAAALLEAYADGVAVWSTPAELTSIAEIARAEAAKIRGGA